MRNAPTQQYQGLLHQALEPIPTGVTPMPVRLPYIDCQPAAHDVQRVLEALALALGIHSFMAAHITPAQGITHHQILTISLVAFRPQHDTYLTITIEHTQRYGLLAIARWTLTDAQGRRRETKPLGLEWDTATTSVSMAQRIAQALAAHEARVCTLPATGYFKYAA